MMSDVHGLAVHSLSDGEPLTVRQGEPSNALGIDKKKIREPSSRSVQKTIRLTFGSEPFEFLMLCGNSVEQKMKRIQESQCPLMEPNRVFQGHLRSNQGRWNTVSLPLPSLRFRERPKALRVDPCAAFMIRSNFIFQSSCVVLSSFFSTNLSKTYHVS